MVDIHTKEKLGSKKLKKDPKTFKLYTSQQLGELNRPPNILKKYLFLLAIGVISLPVLFGFYVYTFFFKKSTPPPSRNPQHIEKALTPTPAPTKKKIYFDTTFNDQIRPK